MALVTRPSGIIFLGKPSAQRVDCAWWLQAFPTAPSPGLRPSEHKAQWASLAVLPEEKPATQRRTPLPHSKVEFPKYSVQKPTRSSTRTGKQAEQPSAEDSVFVQEYLNLHIHAGHSKRKRA
jgi:hypothetical protein